MHRRRPTIEWCGQVAAWVSIVCLGLAGCGSQPLVPYSTDLSPLVVGTAAQAGINDERARFRETYCAVLAARANDVPDYLPCEEALTSVGTEPAGTGAPVDLGPSKRRLVAAVVGGIGYECFEPRLNPTGSMVNHVRQFGYDLTMLKVDPLSGTANNARQIRDAVASYPEIHSRVAAVVSVAGAVGGSALADDSEQYQADLMRHFPGASCGSGDGGAVESLRPAVRKVWLAQHPLPDDLRYYSLVTLPNPERISSVLESSYEKLGRIDARNDSQVIFYDQVVPGSTLVGFVNADHWAVTLPINRTHGTVSALFVTKNAYPREALLEALLRFVEEDLATAR